MPADFRRCKKGRPLDGRHYNAARNIQGLIQGVGIDQQFGLSVIRDAVGLKAFLYTDGERGGGAVVETDIEVILATFPLGRGYGCATGGLHFGHPRRGGGRNKQAQCAAVAAQVYQSFGVVTALAIIVFCRGPIRVVVYGQHVFLCGLFFS